VIDDFRLVISIRDHKSMITNHQSSSRSRKNAPETAVRIVSLWQVFDPAMAKGGLDEKPTR